MKKETQDETFRILKKRPFEEVRDAIQVIVQSKGSSSLDIFSVIAILEEYGWTADEFINKACSSLHLLTQDMHQL